MDPFAYDRYELRRKFFSVIHTDFFLHAPDGAIVLFGRKRGFRLKEDIRLWTSPSMDREVLSIQARGVLDFSATYDVIDSREQRAIGAIRRKGLRSILRDEWILLDASDRQVATLIEESARLALVRRFLTNLVPQAFDVIVDGSPVATIRQNFNPIRLRLAIDFSLDPGRRLDRRLAIAAASLLATIEGRQED
ncbi:MAG: hypothetical protein ACRD2J_11375 [Thermoanaerobaculia bacterium]